MGIGEFPQQAENRFRVTKALLAEEWFKLTMVADKSIILTGLLRKNLATGYLQSRVYECEIY